MSFGVSSRVWSGKAFASAARAGADPLTLMEEFVLDWLGPIPTDERIQEEEIQAAEGRLRRRLPATLRRWFGVIGCRATRLRGNGDRLRLPRELEVSNGVLELIHESQGVWKIGIQESNLQLSDPPVWSFQPEGLGLRPGNLLNSSLGAFALEWAMYSMKYDVPFTAESDGRRVHLARLLADVFRVPSSLCRLWGDDGLSFHVGEDLLVEIAYLNPDQWGSWIGVSARTAAARERALALVKCDWKPRERK